MANSFDLGEFIREQRRNAQISVRQLSKLAGVSNPYLSQIERGLRRPSAEILQQIAKGLRISAEALYVQAGILDERIAGGVVVDAVLADTTLTERQKQVMLEVYDSFRKENERRQTDEALAAQMARRAAPSNDAFAEAVDTIGDLGDLDDLGDTGDLGGRDGIDGSDGSDRSDADSAGGDPGEVVEPVVLPPSSSASMRTTMTRHNPRRLP